MVIILKGRTVEKLVKLFSYVDNDWTGAGFIGG